MKVDPMQFCFSWLNEYGLPELSADKYKKCCGFFSVAVNQNAERSIVAYTGLKRFASNSKQICFHKHQIDNYFGKQALPFSIKHDIVKPIYLKDCNGGESMWFIKGVYSDVQMCTFRLGQIMAAKIINKGKKVKSIKDKSGNSIRLQDEQLRVYKATKKYNISIILGSAGTGKTTIGNFVHKSYKRSEVLSLAYYGRVASNLKKKYGGTAMTIHKLEKEFNVGTKKSIELVENVKVVIVDEISLLTTQLFNVFLKCLPGINKLILLGDDKQMPPPCFGPVLPLLIEKYEGTPILHRLETIMRVDPSKRVLLDNFHKIRNGKTNLEYETDINSNGAFILLERSCQVTHGTREKAMMKDLKKVIDKYPDTKKYQIMTQRNCTRNELTKAYFNLTKKNKQEFKKNTFYLGETIVFTQNDYGTTRETGLSKSDPVMNGETATIVDIYDVMPKYENVRENKDNPPTDDESSEEIDLNAPDVVRQIVKKKSTIDSKDIGKEHWTRMLKLDDGRTVNLSHYSISNISKGSVATISSCQGSEYDIAVVYIHEKPSHTFKREELYTAVTRAKKKVILICTYDDIVKIVNQPCVVPRCYFSEWFPEVQKAN